MGCDYDRVGGLRGLHHDATTRARLLEVLAELGVDVTGAATAPEGPPHTLILWATDEFHSVIAHVVPDELITPAQRAALDAAPFCFAGPEDCGAGQWAAVVRVMAALNVHFMKPEKFYDAYVRDPGYGHEDMPAREEILAAHGVWAKCDGADLAEDGGDTAWVNHRFSGAYAFKLGM